MGAREFLVRQQEAGRYACVEVPAQPSVDAVCNALRDAAAQAHEPVAVLSPECGKRREFFRGAGIPDTDIEKVPRGWRLGALPDLVPIPAPPPPKLRDDDGAPMVPCANLVTEFLELRARSASSRDFEAEIRAWGSRASEGYWTEEAVLRCWSAFVEARETEATPTFRVEDVGPWLFRAEAGITWCPRDTKTASQGSRHGAGFADRVLAAALDDTETVAGVWQQHVWACGPRVDRVREILGPACDVHVPEVLTKARAARDDVNPCRLEAISRAPLMVWPCAPADFKIEASLGAGRLLFVAARRFASERPEPFEWIGGAWDGGDIRLWTTASYDQLLEGESLANTVARRRRAESAAAYEEDDD